MRPLIFISYRRDRGYELAHLVDAELRSRGLRTFIDVAESDPGRFWPQLKAAIHRCRALVLICTNGSLEIRSDDDWVMREVGEAMSLGRPIVPVFSQDFKRPSAIPAPLAQAIEYNGVSMDTQFHVAAFDHLSQLVGGRKRSEQRRRVAVLASVALLTVVAALGLGARAIMGLNAEFRLERDARRDAEAALQKTRADDKTVADQRQRDNDARSNNLAQELAASEKRRTDEKRAAEQQLREAEARIREAEARSGKLAQEVAEAEKRRLAQIRADEEERAKQTLLNQTQSAERVAACRGTCQSTKQRCDNSCPKTGPVQPRAVCLNSCREAVNSCFSGCR